MPRRSFLVSMLLFLFLLCPLLQSHSGELPRVLIQRGERFLAMGKYPAAIRNYSKVIECCEGTAEAAEAHNDLGVVHARQGDMTKAMQEYEAALSKAPYPLAHFNLGKAHADIYTASRDESSRIMALRHLRAFRVYLVAGEDLPSVVSYQRDEIQTYLDSTLSQLSE